ncbi:hypothetical protein M3182_16895 [Mesobacillus maritimus]|uniref:hypothetical protein n=1 Tax=Mesobacillus maritimus TaxID=1643336 RepID=UPI00203C157E|nr:hypothetical protein [Mesobacillus maritimus]MCM3587417.1 hypothetical protein [Mesobacillus maritimus]MCM3667977.1 hypothetical protein [Mesobacillus maritimus]
MLYFLVSLSICFILIILYFNIYIKTSTMAVIMALGIMTQGVISNFFRSSFTQSILFHYSICIILALWIAFFFSLWRSLFKAKFTSLHYLTIMNRFGIGTWVAASSICGVLINRHVSQWEQAAIVIATLNFSLWLGYMVVSTMSLYQIYRTKKEDQVHGIIFLTTVSTQSLVLLLSSFHKPIPDAIDLMMILVGLLFYFISLLFIYRRYRYNPWAIETDWKNTNCIIHGALSISGLACILSQATHPFMIETIWTSAFILFFIVESIELARLVKRIRLYGVRRGIFVYDVSQWSRIFTFAMFYTFTFFIQSQLSYILIMKKIIIHGGIWMILCLTVIELYLSITTLLKKELLRSVQKPTHEVS